MLSTAWPTEKRGKTGQTETSDSSFAIVRAAQARWLQMVDYGVGGLVIFHWSVVATVAIGCVIVMVMNGPGYVADGYKVPHSDRPRETMETEQEAASYRLRQPTGQAE